MHKYENKHTKKINSNNKDNIKAISKKGEMM